MLKITCSLSCEKCISKKVRSGNDTAVFESLQYRMAKLVVWHSPEDTYLNVFDGDLVCDQESKYLNVKDNLLRNKIPLPIDEARNMFGVGDVTGTLKYGQCFIQYQIGKKEEKIYQVVKGTVLVTKNPCLYPGDIRKLQAVDVPLLKRCMRDCIVFPTEGPRPHSDEISGSDLDGDQYWVYWGHDIKINKPIKPLAHSAAEKLIVPEITNEMVIEFFLDAANRNCYSVIVDVHTVIADQKEEGTLSTECVQLATLFSRAIDSPKTGEIIDMDKVSRWRAEFCKSFPRFMMKFDQPYYESSSILEKLYLNAKKIINLITNKEIYERYHITTAAHRRVPLSTSMASNSQLEQSWLSKLLKYLIGNST